MRSGRRKLAVVVALSGLGFAASAQLVLGKKNDKQESAPSQMDDRKRVLHALNRLTFGPRPGDIERVLAMGVDPWIEQQLHPEKINDAPMDALLAPLRTLRMDTREIVDNFPPRQLIKAVAEGRQAMPSDPVKRAVFEAQIERYQEEQKRKQEAVSTDPTDDSSVKKAPLSDEARARRRKTRMDADVQAQELLDMPPDQRIKAILKMPPVEQRALATSGKGSQRNEFMEGMSPQQRETLAALNNPQQVVAGELVQAKLLRATYSERQLQEVMTDFWFNHFNVFLGKGADRYLLTSYERDAIRPHVLGNFEDLLIATAQSPAMLFYLDNWLSVGPNSDVANGASRRGHRNDRKRSSEKNGPSKPSKGKQNGLNENYGRELMELHTLGVNGGYTQQDVTEVARVFTGWTLKRPKEGAGFIFEERMHDPGEKIVLGHRIKPNGEKEGLEVLHILAHHPSTAKFVCGKLATRFVSDNPPSALVDRMAQTFLKKDGDIREVLRTMLRSPEFWSAQAYRAKVKTPLEFAVSALRASGAEVSDTTTVARHLQTLGMPLYGMQPPTGYSMKADAWVNSTALLGRMNFSLALTAGKLSGVQVDSDRMFHSSDAPADPEQTLAGLEKELLAGEVSKQTHDTISAQLQDPKISQRRLDDPVRAPDVGAIAGLLLGSPEFQRK